MRKQKPPTGAVMRRLGAALAALGTLWAAYVTAGSTTAASAVAALRAASPLDALRWELGDLWPVDSLSPATVLTIGESPLLLSARTEMAQLWSSDPEETTSPEDEEEEVTVPVEETPLETLDFTDNGVTARTLVPTDPSGYTVVGRGTSATAPTTTCRSRSCPRTLTPSSPTRSPRS